MCLDTVVVREDPPEAAILELRPASKKSQICEDAGKPAFQTERTAGVKAPRWERAWYIEGRQSGGPCD